MWSPLKDTKNGFGYILGDFLEAHLVTLAIASRHSLKGSIK
jgi:hypothetical protein